MVQLIGTTAQHKVYQVSQELMRLYFEFKKITKINQTAYWLAYKIQTAIDEHRLIMVEAEESWMAF
jgi:hypothetical protein